MNNATQRGEAYHTGYEASNQGESRDNVTSHYPAATWDAAEWLDGFAAAPDDAEYDDDIDNDPDDDDDEEC